MRSLAGLVVLGVALTVSAAGFTGSASATTLDLVVKPSPVGKVDLVRNSRDVRFSMGSLHFEALLGTRGTPLEVWAHRLVPGGPGVVDLIDRTNGKPVISRVAGLGASLNRGLAGFLEIRIRNSSGKVVFQGRDPFCPRGSGFFDTKIAGHDRPARSGRPAVPVFPGAGYSETCGEEQAESLVWMVTRGDPAYYFGSRAHQLADGDYTYEVTVNPDGLIAEKSLANNRYVQKFRLTTDRRRWRKLIGGPDNSKNLTVAGRVARRQAAVSRRPSRQVKPPAVGQITGPPGALPDLAALSASKFAFDRLGGKDRISFSSIIANYGDAPLALFGSRGGTAGTKMRGWQFLKDANGELVRRPTNGFVWDQRDSHLHWHYNRLAVYELVNMDGKTVRRSAKVGFCFMPTTALRFLPVSGSLGVGTPFSPAPGGLKVECGRRKSTRVAMSLDAGWGDEYYQAIAGQSLDVTDVAAGRYRLRITVNGEGDLAESNSLNNVSERMIELGGSRDRRTLSVPRQGIVSPEFIKLANYGNNGRARVSSGGWGQTATASRLLCGLTPPV